MAKKKEDWSDKVIRQAEDFAEKMSEWADTFSEKMSERFKDSDFSYNSSEINQDGKKIVVKSNNKQIIITVNDKEVYKETKK